MPGGDQSHAIQVELLNPDGSVFGQTRSLRDMLYDLTAGIAGIATSHVFSGNRSNLVVGQTTFGIPGGYTPGQADVYLNGLRLVPGDDVDVTSGTSVVLQFATSITDILLVVTR